jgi:hypothetical protein
MNRNRSARCVGLLLVVFALIVVSDVSAQPYEFEPRLLSSVAADGLHLEVTLDWGYNAWPTEPAGIDLYRRTIAISCGSWDLVTAQPVPWAWLEDPYPTPHMSFEVVDDGAQPGVGYVYQIRAVDADRNAIPENIEVFLGVATHGIALLGHGTLYGGPGGCGESYVRVIENCSLECFPALRFSGEPEIEQYINSGTPVLVYGVIEDVMWTCQVNEIVAHLYTATPHACVSPVEKSTWGSVKSRYR